MSSEKANTCFPLRRLGMDVWIPGNLCHFGKPALTESPRILSAVSRSVEPILMLVTNASSLGPSPEHWSMGFIHKNKVTDALLQRCSSQGTFRVATLKLCCDNCHVEISPPKVLMCLNVYKKNCLASNSGSFGRAPTKSGWTQAPFLPHLGCFPAGHDTCRNPHERALKTMLELQCLHRASLKPYIKSLEILKVNKNK